MRIYLDSSVLLRYLLAGDDRLCRLGDEARLASSELIGIECRRVLQRERLEGRLDDEHYSRLASLLASQLEDIDIIEMTEAVKRRAGESFPTIVGTLDALHLSSALILRDAEKVAISILSYDRQMTTCAKAMGFALE
ncbi:MAG TPA: type II toxin-antitoxin system VapC family toxin [Rectinemataceae bacterium]|nr:type II toxin-antitoxin system VapC family toxin [Rectinemataceae bacterium]